MANDLGVRLSVEIASSIKNAEAQMDAFIKKYDNKEINFKINSNELNNINAQLDNINKKFNSLGANNFKSINNELLLTEKNLKKQSETWNGKQAEIGQVTKSVKEYSDAVGQAIKVTESLQKDGTYKATVTKT